jgi:xanthine dehydrogenase accessory factor
VIRAELLERAAALRAQRVPFVAATVVRVERPASAKPGDCALVLPDDALYGFVGGECAEATVRSQAAAQLSAGESVLLRITPGAGSPVIADGLVTVPNHCLSGGTIDVFLEVVKPPMLVLVYGETPIAHSLAEVGRAAGWEVRAASSPADCANRPPITGPLPQPAGPVAVVVASHGGDEVPVLHEALRAGVPYVGLVASRKRGAAIADSLQLDEEQRERFHTPAGLDIGAHRPGEIAVSILAEIVAVVPESYTRSL